MQFKKLLSKKEWIFHAFLALDNLITSFFNIRPHLLHYLVECVLVIAEDIVKQLELVQLLLL